MCKHEQDSSTNIEKKEYKIIIMGDRIKLIDKNTGEVYAVIHAVNGKLRGDETEDQYTGTIKEGETYCFLTCNRISEKLLQINIYCKSPFKLMLAEKTLPSSYEEVLAEYVMEYPTGEEEFEFSFTFD